MTAAGESATIPRGAGAVSQQGRWLTAHLLGRLPAPRRGWLIALLLVTPAILFRLFTSIYPFVQTVWWSFTDRGPGKPNGSFVGLDNFRRIRDNPATMDALKFTLWSAVAVAVLSVVGGFLLAMLLVAKFRGRPVVRALILVPWAIPTIVSALGFRFMLSNGFGIVPQMLGHAHVHTDWLLEPFPARMAVIGVTVWHNVPFLALIIMAGIQGIPAELMEAAKVDGAGWLRVNRHIVVPLVTPLLVTMATFVLIFQIGTFDVVYGLTGGGPGTATAVLPFKAYQEAFIGQETARASAMAVTLFVVVSIVGAAALVVFRRSQVHR